MSDANKTAYRIEKDFLGEKQIPADAYYGVQTQRGKDSPGSKDKTDFQQ